MTEIDSARTSLSVDYHDRFVDVETGHCYGEIRIPAPKTGWSMEEVVCGEIVAR